jgi:hypothetical protein
VVEALFAGIGVQDDLAMTGGEFNQLLDDRFAESGTLATRVHRDVANVGAIDTVGESAPDAHHLAIIEDKAFVAAVRE